MRRIRIIIIAMVIAILFVNAICACSVQNSALADASTSVQSGGKNNMKLLIDNVEVPVEWEDNESLKQILNIASSSDIIVHAHRYGSFEQVGELGHSIASNNIQMTTEPGDIVLYNGNNIVVFFGNNSWSYTKLGKIKDKNLTELKALLDKSSATLTLTIKK